MLYDPEYAEAYNNKKKVIELEQAFIRYFQEYAQALVSYETIYSRLKHFKEFFIKKHHIRFLHEIHDDKIWAYILWRRKQRKPSTRKNPDGTLAENTNDFVSDATIAKELHTFNNMNTMAIDIWKTEASDFKLSLHKKHLKKNEPLNNHIEETIQPLFIEELPEYLKAPLVFSILTGLRWGNVRGFETKQIDWQVRKIKFYIKSRLYVEGKLHEVELTPAIEWVLDSVGVILETCKANRRVFTYNNGFPLGDHRRAIDSALKRAGIKRLKGQCVHLLRHTAGTNYQDHQGDVIMTKELLGHVKIQTTTIYAHGKKQKKIDTIEAVAERFLHINLKTEK